MAANLTVRADVIDISNDVPQKEDIFMVDTNVWFWQTYSNAELSGRDAPARVSEYSAYLSSALSNEATLTYSGVILAELTHIIEKTEYEIYLKSNGLKPKDLRSKEYRHNLPNERLKVVSEVQFSWSQVKEIAVPLDLSIDEETTHAALTRFQTQAVDGYDLLILEAASRESLTKFITHDSDYVTVPDIQVFTSNQNAIESARIQGRLVSR
jgi:predicted nucleic acid-binding protein